MVRAACISITLLHGHSWTYFQISAIVHISPVFTLPLRLQWKSSSVANGMGVSKKLGSIWPGSAKCPPKTLGDNSYFFEEFGPKIPILVQITHAFLTIFLKKNILVQITHAFLTIFLQQNIFGPNYSRFFNHFFKMKYFGPNYNILTLF